MTTLSLTSCPWIRGGRNCWRVAAAVLLLCGARAVAADPYELPPLTTVSGSPRLPGKFVWADLLTDDAAAARKFYSQMFGWTFEDVGNYLIGANDERPLCGILQRPRPADRPQARPRWIAYVSVSSIEGTQRAVMKAGGKVQAAPQTFPRRGTQAVFADAEGAVFGAVKSSSGDPQDFQPDPGDWIWIQLLSRNAKSASEFYRSVGGYDVIENTKTNRVSDYVLASEGFARATIRTIPAGHDQVQPDWLPFVRVKDAGASVAKAKELGGKVLIEPRPELLGGKVAVIADPTGAAIGILEWSDDLLRTGGK